MDTSFSNFDTTSLLDSWDTYLPDDKEQTLFEMLDEDMAYLNESRNTLIQDIMWNSPGDSNFGSFDSDLGSLDFTSITSNGSLSHSLQRPDQSSSSSFFAQTSNPSFSHDHDFYDKIFSKKLDEEFPSPPEFDDFDFDSLSPLSEDHLYGSCVSSPLSIDSEQPFLLDDTGFNSENDVENLISSLPPNSFTDLNSQSAQIFMNQIPSFDLNVSSKTQVRAVISGTSVQTRKNAASRKPVGGRLVGSSRGESLIMRSTSGAQIQKAKAKTGPKTSSAVSMLSNRSPSSIGGGVHSPNNSIESRKSSQFTQIKHSLKSRQATRADCSMLKSNNATSLSLLSTQEAMLKDASSLISPPISSDSDESVDSMQESREKNMLKKKRMSSAGAGSACSGRANILTSIQPGVLTSSGTSLRLLSGTPATVTTQAQTNQQGNRPLKRREHNDSERKRRDHLRSAFEELRFTIPKLNTNERKPARIMILAEAASYAREITENEAIIQQKKKEALAEQQRLQSLLEHYASHGLV